MTKDEARHLAEVLKAWADGATMQWRPRGTDHWRDCVLPAIWEVDLFDPDKCEYRIKPEPREWILEKPRVEGGNWLGVLEGDAPWFDPKVHVRVREVLDV